ARGATGNAVTLTFHNTSNGDVTLTGAPLTSSDAVIAVAPTASGGCTANKVITNTGAGSTCTFTATFAPVVATPIGIFDGTVTVTSDAGATVGGVQARVKNNAILSIAAPSNSPNFGDVLVSTTSTTRTWT